MRRPILFSLLAVPLFAAGLVVAACSDEAEGQPCSHQAGNNGSDDCASGLTCQDIIGVQGPRCCPQNRSQATTPECALPSTGVDASPLPPDAKTTMDTSTQDSTSEAQGEAAADAPAEGSSDAPAESAADGGDAAVD
jgi:hypothetical protein